MLIKQNWLSLSIMAILMGLLLIMSGIPAQANSPAPPPELLQFTAGRHMLGFLPDKVYLVGLPHMLSLEFEGTDGVAPLVGDSDLTGFQNLSGLSRGEDIQSAPPLTSVSYPNLWDGISLTYEAAAGGIAKSTYRLEPYADVGQIRLRYNLPLALLADGSLQFTPQWGTEEATGYISESAPIAWQEIDGQRIPVKVSFRLIEQPELSIQNPKPVLSEAEGSKIQNRVGFRLGYYNPAYPLLIDPTYQWHTFMGGGDSDESFGIAVDGSGNVYVTGASNSTWDGPGATAPLNPYAGINDIVVLKLNSNGAYQWHTFMGSFNMDRGWGIAVDRYGNVYVSGESNFTWDGPGATAPLNPHAEDMDIVVLKLNSSGAYQWHTFMGVTGAGGFDYGHGIAVDGSGDVYVSGESTFTWDGPGGAAPLNPHAGVRDIVVLKLNSNGAYQWHTFMGGNNEDWGYGIAIDRSSNVYITGYSETTWDGPGSTAPLNPHGGGDFDIVVLKLNSKGAYQWHTFMGGGHEDWGWDVAVDGSSNVYVTGYSATTWDGPGTTPPLNSHEGSWDIVVLKLNSNGAYQWHTFMGCSSTDQGWGIAVDGSDNVYVAGESDSTWDGPGETDPLNHHEGNNDIVVLKLNSSGAYQWHTFMGSSNVDWGRSIAVDGSGNVNVAGSSHATWDGPGSTTPLNAYAGNWDIVVLKFGQPALNLTKTVDNRYPTLGQRITYTIAINNSGLVSAANALISDTLPVNVTFAGPVTLDPPQSNAILATSALSLPTMASKVTITALTSITLTLPVTVDLNVTTNTFIINTAAVTSAEVNTPVTGRAILGGHIIYLPTIFKN